MNAIVQYDEPQLPAPVARRGITEAQWRTAMNNLFPGAKAESVLMVFDYCAARKLDPLKKPCHIVPMQVKSHGEGYVWRDVVMPGIYEYRTTAARTGQYMGHSKPEYGPTVDYLGRDVPEWCSITVYRWNEASKQRAEYPVTVWFEECCATKWDKELKKDTLNARWTKAPRQMITKCTEAAGLREAFPDELGGTHTADEMEGQLQTQELDITPLPKIDPRGDLSQVDWELRDKHVSSITDILNADLEANEIADKLRAYVAEHLQPEAELWIAVNDKLAEDKIVTKAQMKKWLSLNLHGTREHDVG